MATMTNCGLRTVIFICSSVVFLDGAGPFQSGRECCDIVDTPQTRRITPVHKYRGAILP